MSYTNRYKINERILYYDIEEVIADTGWQGADAQQIFDAIRLLVEIET